MDALNALRAVLVGCAAVAAVLLAIQGMWVPTAVMSAGILAHVGLWWWLHAQKRREAAANPLHELTAER